jgi:hypothetical protein
MKNKMRLCNLHYLLSKKIMNRFISTLTLCSSTAIVSILGLSLAASAAPTVGQGEVQMSATIGNSCLFDNVTDGFLGAEPSALDTLKSSLPSNGITLVDGTSGSIEVTCNDAGSSINITSVTETNTASATLDTFTATVSGSGLSSDITSVDGALGTPVVIGSTNTETLDVDLDATYLANLAPGNYNFIVSIEATP